ncbi:hypothetical protein DRQ53_09155 [bacterium]|nr:MAG: hypothetical protein DRQ53_09155 [bacterium]
MFKGLFGSRSQRHYARGIEYFNAGSLSEAIICFDEAIDVEAEGPDAALARFYRAEAHAGLGATCLEQEDWEQALVHFDAALQEHEHFPDLHVQRAIALLRSGDPLEAERAAAAALTLNPDLTDAGAVLIVALQEQGDPERASHVATQWARIAAASGSSLAPSFESVPTLFADLLEHRARRSDRRRSVEHAESCLRDGFWAEAADVLQPLVSETPDYPDLRLRLAAARLGLLDLDDAAAQLVAALDSNPRFADAHVLAGIVRLRMDEVQAAREHFDLAAEHGRVALACIYGRILCDLRGGRFLVALESMNRLAGEDDPPQSARALHACLEAVAGRRETARERFEALVAATVRTDFLIDALVWATGQGEFDLALRAFDRIDDEDRTRPDTVRAHAALRLAEGDRERARQLCESALLNHPADVGLRMDLARILALCGLGDAGLRCLDALPQALVQLSPVRTLRAHLLRIEGRIEAARAALQGGGEEPGTDATLELLYLCRESDEGPRAGALYHDHSAVMAPSLVWRVQDPARWLGPLRPWPAQVQSTDSGN